MKHRVVRRRRDGVKQHYIVGQKKRSSGFKTTPKRISPADDAEKAMLEATKHLMRGEPVPESISARQIERYIQQFGRGMNYDIRESRVEEREKQRIIERAERSKQCTNTPEYKKERDKQRIIQKAKRKEWRQRGFLENQRIGNRDWTHRRPEWSMLGRWLELRRINSNRSPYNARVKKAEEVEK
jgi:hypothetical protein